MFHNADECETLIKRLVLELAEARRCLAHESCSVCGRLYSVDPDSGLGCCLADHVEAFAALGGPQFNAEEE